MKVIVNTYVPPEKKKPDTKQRCKHCGSHLEVESHEFQHVNEYERQPLFPWGKKKRVWTWMYDCAACRRRNRVTVVE